MKTIQEQYVKKTRPVRMIQFGTGNFLRAFIDDMIDRANEAGVMDCGIAMVKSTAGGNLEVFRKQNCMYTVSLRGLMDGERQMENRVVTSVQVAYDCNKEYDTYLKLAELDTLEFAVSNTTEAGIVFDETDRLQDKPPKSFPGKLTQFLWYRFSHFNGELTKGLIVLPMELIERNGDKLKECVLRFAKLWALGETFSAWVENACVFCSTLVDRIVTGFPQGEPEAEWKLLGYRDELLDAAEPFGFLAIESEKDISNRLPLDKISFSVIFTADQRPYRERKVRILNGAHTATVPAAFLMGKDIVREAMQDPLVREYMTRTVFDEIIPTVPLPREEAEQFANQVFERFANPFVDHSLLSITLNSVSKWKARVLPSFRDRYEQTDEASPLLTFSFAALLAFYLNVARNADGTFTGRRGDKSYSVKDDAAVLDFFWEIHDKSPAEAVSLAAQNVDFWEEDLTRYPAFAEKASHFLADINALGMREAMKNCLETFNL